MQQDRGIVLFSVFRNKLHLVNTLPWHDLFTEEVLSNIRYAKLIKIGLTFD